MDNHISNNEQMSVSGGSASGGKLVMITRKIDPDDALAGFAYNWVKKIGSNLDKLYVISWQAGNAAGLPDNIKVYFLPQNKFAKVLSLWKLVWKILPKTDGLFCHMNPEYTILAGPLAKIFRKKIVSWYAHGSVNWKTKSVLFLADRVITSTESGFRIKSPKVSIIGQGIDVDIFKPREVSKDNNELINIITIGRISPTKDYESMIKAVDILAGEGMENIKLTVIGGSGLKEQNSYFDSLKKMVISMGLEDKIKFIGEVANKDIIPYLQKSDLFINLSQTGSLDKAILEAMACGLIVLTANESCQSILPLELMVRANQPRELSEKIKMITSLSDDQKNNYSITLRNEVVNNHNLKGLAKKIISAF